MEESMFCDENGKPFPRTNKFDMELYNKELEKENKKLKAEIESLNGEIRVLIGANQQLNSMFKVKDECAREYIEQIEKMKCCGNCKHYNYCPMQSNKECQNDNSILKYKWELAE